MKSYNALAAALLAVFTQPPIAGLAGSIVKANNATVLNDPGSWVGGVVPGNGDVAKWDATVTAGNTVSLGGNLAWSGIEILNPGGTVTLSVGNTLTLGAGGLDMSAATQNFTPDAAFTAAADQIWTLANGRTVTLKGNTTWTFSGYDWTLDGPGVVSIGQCHPKDIGTLTISNGVILTSNRANLTTTRMKLEGTGQIKVNQFGGGNTIVTIGAGGLVVTQPDEGAYVPIQWLYDSSSNRRAQLVLNGDLTFVGDADNPETTSFTVNTPTCTFGDGPWTIGAARTFNIGDGAAGVDLAIQPFFAGAGSIEKTGTGTLALDTVTNSTYSGGTTVSSGTLLVCNVVYAGTGSGTGTGAVAVEDGATLGGTGSIAGATTVANGGSLAPGRLGAGTLTTGDLSLGGGAALLFQLGHPWASTGENGPSPNDHLVVDGDLVLDGELTVQALEGLDTSVYTLASYAGTLTDNGLEVASMPEGFSGRIAIDTTGKSVNLHVVSGTLATVIIIQ